MSKAEERALEAYPDIPLPHLGDGIVAKRGHLRGAYTEGYEQAEKDTIERVCEWLKKNITYIHPRTGKETCMINLNALREAIEEDEK